MVEVKELYQKNYMKSLADDIRENYVDDVKNILLALIKGRLINNIYIVHNFLKIV